MPSISPPMMTAGLILAFTFIGIFTEKVHGLERAKFGMLGAGLMVLAGNYFDFYDSRQIIEAVDWNVVLLLGCMMAIVELLIPTGGFERLALTLARLSRGNSFWLMVLIGTAVTVISLLLDNVTTVVIFGPLIILICRQLGISPVPCLLAAALLSDTGGVATLVGDPPNLMIGSAAGIDFNSFVSRMGFPVLAAWFATLLVLRVLFAREFSKNSTAHMPDAAPLSNSRLWWAGVLVFAAMVVLFMLHSAMGWEPWMVSAAGLTVLLFVDRHKELDATMTRVEIPLLMFFISLFVLVGGVEHSGLLHVLGTNISSYFTESPLMTVLIVMWVSAILSAMIDNIPFTAAMIPIFLQMEQQGVNITPLWWALAIGVGMGGNGTHIGSTANVYIVTLSERLAKETGNPGYAITPGLWFRKGTPAMLATLVVSSVIFVVFFDFFSAPVGTH
ncbi:MAG: SLC13 family permease [Gammaproteobacteria bacterium]|jgi:Na+/H+ antiporter NhaD/arsenite permease-like protein|nr:SLC13 family permease [Gammaproteobacteria bacterium]